jgi:HK97 gp10 family phage protein
MSKFDRLKGNGWTLEWEGERVRGELYREFRKRLQEAGNVVRKEVRTLVGKSGKASNKSKGVHSLPGFPPLKQTGFLYKHVDKSLKKLRMRIWVRDRKAHLLEFGTRKMAARPFLRQSVVNRQSEIKQILSKFMR